MHFAMMDHERPTFLMHTCTRQTPMRNEGERDRRVSREGEGGDKGEQERERERERGDEETE